MIRKRPVTILPMPCDLCARPEDNVETYEHNIGVCEATRAKDYYTGAHEAAKMIQAALMREPQLPAPVIMPHRIEEDD